VVGLDGFVRDTKKMREANSYFADVTPGGGKHVYAPAIGGYVMKS